MQINIVKKNVLTISNDCYVVDVKNKEKELISVNAFPIRDNIKEIVSTRKEV